MNVRLTVGLLTALLTVAAGTAAQPIHRGVELGVTIQASDIEDLATWKANTARYSLIWLDPAALDAADEAAYNEWLDSALQRFDELLPVLQQNNIQVVLNLHTPPGGFVRRDAKATHRVFAEQWAQEAFIRVWQKIALRYRGNQAIWVFDLLNEPAQYSVPQAPLKEWKTLASEAIAAIRAIDPERTISVGPAYGDAKKLAAFGTLPFDNLVYTIHFYKPFRFLHQGVAEMPLGPVYPSPKHNKQFLQRALEPAVRFQQQYHVPIYIGEFVANRWAPRNSGFRYLKDVLQIFESHGWSWTYHSYRGADVWSVEHGTQMNNTTPAVKPTNRLRLLLKYFGLNG